MYHEKMYDAIMSMIGAYNDSVTEWNDTHNDTEDWRAWIITNNTYAAPTHEPDMTLNT